MKGKYLSLIFILTFLFSSVLFNVPLIQASGEGWLDGWSHRKSHVINPSSGAGTNYQIMVIVYNTTGTDSGNTAYVGGNVQPDFDDIRFTASDGSTLLKYWLENTSSTATSSIFWVKVSASLSTSAQTIYMYYGNPSASSLSDAKGTSNLYDGFGTYNTTTWQQAGNTIQSGVTTDIDYSSVTVLEVIGDGGYFDGHATKYTFSMPLKVRARVRHVTSSTAYGTDIGPCLSNTTPSTSFSYNPYTSGQASMLLRKGRIGVDAGAPNNLASFLGTSATVYAASSAITTYRILQTCLFTSNASLYENNVLKKNGSVSVSNNVVYLNFGKNTNQQSYVDWVIILKYVSPEPSHGAWVSESVFPYSVARFTFNVSNPEPNDIIQFDGSTSIILPSAEADYHWLFGDETWNTTSLNTLRPNADGDINEWSETYASVNDRSDFTYASASVWHLSSLYNLDNLSGIGIITSVMVKVVAKSDSIVGPAKMKILVKSEGTEYFGDEINLDTAWTTYSYNITTLKTWNLTLLNDLQTGEYSTFYWGYPLKVSEVWTEVNSQYSASGEIVTHSYLSEGTYSVNLKVTSSEEITNSFTQNLTIETKLPPFIVASFTWTPNNPDVNETVIFNGSKSNSSSPITNYEWNFGDGNTTSGNYPIITHSYLLNGTNIITLTVFSDVGSNNQSIEITIGGVTDTGPFWFIMLIIVSILTCVIAILAFSKR